jgi:uncharacterized repeat protein (TIGR02543 family)
MKRILWVGSVMVLVLISTLFACGGGGGDGSSTPNYTVTYNDNGATGGTVQIDTTNYHQGQTVTVQGNTGNLVRTGYDFTGWNTLVNGSGTTYTSGQTFTMGTANVTLYAMWTAIATNAPTGISTAAITNYMASAYQTELISLESETQAIENQQCAEGNIGSCLQSIVNAKSSLVQTFINDALNFVQTTINNGYPIDKQTIISLFNSYRTQDISFFYNLFSGSSLISMVPGCTLTVNNAYDAAITEINAM